MSASDTSPKPPQDLVAIFHASFHPTRGNIVDWCLKASEDLNLDHVEFSALPSGLHLVREDVIYFTKDGLHGVCIFRRRKTVEHGHRGFRLSSLGILLAKSRRPRPWRHVKDLKHLTTTIYRRSQTSGALDPTEFDWEPASAFFEERKIKRADLGGAREWNGWGHELGEIETDPSGVNPTLHLPHLLRILGPSSLSLYKHVLARRRILIYTLPPVEAACVLCQVAADMCYDLQQERGTDISSPAQPIRTRKGKCSDAINVLGIVTLNDLDRMHAEGQTGRGWIACTTDAIFLDKPSCYDLLIDLTTSTPSKATRPTFYSSKPVVSPSSPSAKGPSHRLSMIRFAWSDIKLWNELDRILLLDADSHSQHSCCGSSTTPESRSKLTSTWSDVWRVYEDVCVMCAGLWIGSWRSNSKMSYSTAGGSENWGKKRLEGDDDLSMTGDGFVRSLGLGIEGRPSGSATNKAMRSTSGMSWSSGRGTIVNTNPDAAGSSSKGKARRTSMSTAATMAMESEEQFDVIGEDERRDRNERQMMTTLSLLQTFHAHSSFQLSMLDSFIPDDGSTPIVYISPKDLVLFELGPFSGSDAKYLEWLSSAYGGGSKIIVRRGWRDLLGVLFGY